MKCIKAHLHPTGNAAVDRLAKCQGLGRLAKCQGLLILSTSQHFPEVGTMNIHFTKEKMGSQHREQQWSLPKEADTNIPFGKGGLL